MFKYLNADYYHSNIKEKLVKDFLKLIPSTESILDIGAGEMPYKKYCSHLKYTSQDFCKYDGKGDNRMIQTGSFDTEGIDIVSDVGKIPLPDQSFDNILCTEVLEHVEDPFNAIKEMMRILKPKGKILITAPGTSLLHFSPYHYYTGFKINFFETILPKAGFNINRIVRIGNIYSVIALYLWYIMDGRSKAILPAHASPLFKVLILIFSPLIIFLIGIGRINRLDTGLLEAGFFVIGTKN